MQLKSLITLADVVAELGYVTMLVHKTTWHMFQHAWSQVPQTLRSFSASLLISRPLSLSTNARSNSRYIYCYLFINSEFVVFFVTTRRQLSYSFMLRHLALYWATVFGLQ